MTFTHEHWEALMACPGWQAMKRFLMDSRAKIGEQIMNSQVPADTLTEAICRCQDFKDVAEMDWETIAEFYDIPLTPEGPKQ